MIYLGLVKCVFDALLDFFSQRRLHVLADKLAVDSVAISDRKEMRATILTQVRKNKERVLVGFVRVLGAVARLGSECKLGHTIIKLFVGLARLNSMLMILTRRNFL